MITKIKIGNILESESQTLINTVNCVGVMGKGIAADFKKRFPDMFSDYKVRCENKNVKPGVPYIYKSLVKPWIINFPTKNHWRSVSKIEDIEKGVNIILNNYKEWGITSLAVPPLGCGNGQLEWAEVGPLLYQKFKKIDIPVELYAVFGALKNQLTTDFLESKAESLKKLKNDKPSPKFIPEWLVLIEILEQIKQNPYHRPIGRTFLQKIGYIATAQGVPTGLKYAEGSYGPFSEDLKKAITIMANNNLIIEEHSGTSFLYHAGNAYPKMRDKYQDLFHKYQKIIKKTTDLFMRMDTNQAEIVSTVLYSSRKIKKNKPTDEVNEKDIFDYVMKWKKRRHPPLKESDVASAVRNLVMLQWLKAKYSPELPVRDIF